MKDVRLLLDFHLFERGLAPLVVDGEPTPVGFWGFPRDLTRRLERLSTLYDRRAPVDRKTRRKPLQPFTERDRQEFNALLALLEVEIAGEIGSGWQLVVDTPPIPAERPTRPQRKA